MHSALGKCTEHIHAFGGHSMAIGLTVYKDKIKDLYLSFEEQAEICEIENIQRVVEIDSEQKLSNVTIQSVEELEKLEPYGEANRMPNFMFRNLKIDAIRQLSEGKHIKLILRDNIDTVEVIGFNQGDIINDMHLGDIVDVVGNIEINEFNNSKKVQLLLRDIRKSF